MAIKLLLLVTAIVQVWGCCKIESDVLGSLKQILAVKEGSEPLRLLIQDTIADGATLYLLCGKKLTESKCQDNAFHPRLQNIKPCRHTAKAKIVKHKRDDRFKCIIYNVNLPFYYSKCKKEYLTLYQSCYDIKSRIPVYTVYWAYPVPNRCRRPNTPFIAQPPAPTDANIRLTRQNVYARFEQLYGANQPYHKENETLINRGHLVPSSGYAFCAQQTITFNFVNVVPQFKNINSGNWLKIEEYVRNIIHPDGVKVTTGSVGVLEFENINRQTFLPLYLKALVRGCQQLPVPKWTYKKIEGHDKVYLVYNSLFGIDSLPEPKCGIVDCNNITLLPAQQGGKTFCCSAKVFDSWLQNEMNKV